ncbi:hypothetical protein B0H13DRAFT_2345495 [Mycena leptocephala]|nr:hypothetical protein B0H13DRAFT_2345495 [Mycena leptocephala]
MFLFWPFFERYIRITNLCIFTIFPELTIFIVTVPIGLPFGKHRQCPSPLPICSQEIVSSIVAFVANIEIVHQWQCLRTEPVLSVKEFFLSERTQSMLSVSLFRIEADMAHTIVLM